MAIAILGDTHMPKGERALPAACLDVLRSSELIVHTGDFTGTPVLRLLRSLGPELIAVHGNVDVPEIAAELPETAVVEPAPGIRIAVIHDAGARQGRLARMRRRFPDADAVVFGHSHLPLHERDENGFQIFNPGSPTERRRAPRHSMGIAAVADGELRLEHLWL